MRSKVYPITFIIIICLSVSVFASVPYRLSDDVVPTGQVINLTLNPDERYYEGDTEIQLEVKNSVNRFSLHSETLDIQKVTLSKDGTEIPTTFDLNESSSRLNVNSDQMLPSGECLLEIEFTNNFDSQATSLYRLDYEGESYLYTQMEDIEAREAFPCFDEPIFKIPYQLVLTVPTTDSAIGNMAVESVTTEAEMKTVTFKKSPPMPSYLIAIAVGPFDVVPIPGIPFPANVVAPKGKASLTSFAVKSTPPILFALENYFDSKYPYEKLDLIAVPEFWPGAMENPGAITYAEGILLFDEQSTTSLRKLVQLSTTAHEIAHMWFGDLVTMEWWDDLWLNEAFATWLGNKITDQVFPEYELELNRVNSHNGPMISDARPSSKAIRQPITDNADLLGNIGAIYQKGEAVLKMFEQEIGAENFRRGVLDYIESNKWGNATASDLWTALDNVSEFDVSKAMETFIEQPGLPLVDINLNEDNSITLTQQRFANYGHEYSEEQLWQIPITIKYSSGSSVQTKSIMLKEASQTFTLSSDGEVQWFYPNVDSRGYYRYTLSEEMLLKLADNAVNYLTPKERIGYLNNLSALLDAGIVGGGDYLRLVSQFKDDENMLVLSTLMNALGKVENAFVSDETRDQFAVYVNKTLAPALQKVGMTPHENESEREQQLRPSLLNWLAEHGRDPEVLKFAETNFEKYMSDPASVDPSLIGLSVSLGCIRGDMELWEECRQRFEKAQTPQERGLYLSALGSFEDTLIQKKALEYNLNGPIRPQEFFTITRGIANFSNERQDYVFNWFREHYQTIVDKTPPQNHGFFPYFASGCSQERLEVAKIFFSKEEHNKPGTEIQLAKLTDQVTDCVTLREREQANVNSFLAKFAQ